MRTTEGQRKGSCLLEHRVVFVLTFSTDFLLQQTFEFVRPETNQYSQRRLEETDSSITEAWSDVTKPMASHLDISLADGSNTTCKVRHCIVGPTFRQ